MKVLPSPSVTTDYELKALPVPSADSGLLITGDRPTRILTASAPKQTAGTQFSSQGFHTTVDLTKIRSRQKSHTVSDYNYVLCWFPCNDGTGLPDCNWSVMVCSNLQWQSLFCLSDSLIKYYVMLDVNPSKLICCWFSFAWIEVA